MPSIERTIFRETALVRTPRLMQMAGMFDLAIEERSRHVWDLQFDLPDEWNIGCIVGPSGAGKTTAAKELFGDQLIADWLWPTDQSLLDGFPAEMGIKEIVGLLSSVGFASPPGWCKPFHVLSNGEKFRVNLARTLAEKPDLAVVDEFTSMVDRTVAQIGSAALAKTIRRRGGRFVAVTCHFDVLDWLQPDWIYEPATGAFERRSLRRRPAIELKVVCTRPSAWRLFQDHHYLTGSLHPSARCFVASINQRPAAFVAALPFPHPRRSGWREHRCVCLPDFQGVGVGNALSEFVGSLYRATGKPYRSVTSHPGMIAYRRRSPLWRQVRAPSRLPRQRGALAKGSLETSSRMRLTSSFEFVGMEDREAAVQFGVIAA